MTPHCAALHPAAADGGLVVLAALRGVAGVVARVEVLLEAAATVVALLWALVLWLAASAFRVHGVLLASSLLSRWRPWGGSEGTGWAVVVEAVAGGAVVEDDAGLLVVVLVSRMRAAGWRAASGAGVMCDSVLFGQRFILSTSSSWSGVRGKGITLDMTDRSWGSWPSSPSGWPGSARCCIILLRTGPRAGASGGAPKGVAPGGPGGPEGGARGKA